MLELLRPFSVLEAVRSGTLAMSKCKMINSSNPNENDDKLNAASAIDESSLPPG